MSRFKILAASLTLACAAAHAEPVASYSFGAAGFEGGGFISGAFTGLFTPSGLPFPFSAGTGHIVTSDVSAFSATLSGNATLPDVSWELAELQSLRLVEPNPGTPAGTPVALELRAFDLATEIELLLRVAVGSDIADALFGPGAFLGARLEDTLADGDTRIADSVVVEFVGLVDGGGSVPAPSSLALALLALLLVRQVRQVRQAPRGAQAASHAALRRRAAAWLLPLGLLSAGAAWAADTEPATPATADRLAAARALIAEDRWAAAIEALRRVDDRGSADWHNLMGYSLRKARTPDLAAALRHYDEALRLDPRHRGALEYSGELFLTLGELPRAEARARTLAQVCGAPCPELATLQQAIAQHKSRLPQAAAPR
jgi:tetratricopeptide (TPR) repeat protein